MHEPGGIDELLGAVALIDRAAPAATRMAWAQVPAKMACYLLEGAAGEPVLLATVGDLRAALKRRLADTPAEVRSSRVEYGRIAARVRYAVVHSPFAANWCYLQAARRLFPKTYRQMISWRPTHFLAIHPHEAYPHFVRTEDLSEAGAEYFGPIAERRAADRLIETVQDLFELCRYQHILVQAPHGKACAYKEMGKCPAPCDGSIPMRQYLEQIRAAMEFLAAPDDALHSRVGYERWRAAQEERMKAAAAALQFEAAAKIKQGLERARLIESESLARMDSIARCAYLALQPGQGKPYLEPFLIHGGTITRLEPIKRKGLTPAAQALYLQARQRAAIPVRTPLLPEQTEAISLVAYHLFRGPDDAGLYLPIRYLQDAGDIERACIELWDRQRPAKPLAEQESVQTDV